MEFELTERVPFNERKFLPLLYKVVGESATKEQFQQVSDDQIWERVNDALDILLRQPAGEERDLRVRTCQCCGKAEKRVGKLKSCTRCKAAFYCSKECQVKDWPSHKKICKKAAAIEPRTGPYDLVEGATLPDGRTVMYKIFR